jgi:hypothetical protein
MADQEFIELRQGLGQREAEYSKDPQTEEPKP